MKREEEGRGVLVLRGMRRISGEEYKKSIERSVSIKRDKKNKWRGVL
jgi:hypothetical protein